MAGPFQSDDRVVKGWSGWVFRNFVDLAKILGHCRFQCGLEQCDLNFVERWYTTIGALPFGEERIRISGRGRSSSRGTEFILNYGNDNRGDEEQRQAANQ